LYYRPSREEPFPAALQDALNGVKRLREHILVIITDPNHIAFCGVSSGTRLASLVATSGKNQKYIENRDLDF